MKNSVIYAYRGDNGQEIRKSYSSIMGIEV